MTSACVTRPRPRLATVNGSPVPEPKPLISSEARRKEQDGERFYPRVHLAPQELPSMYLALSSFPRRVERRTWRTPLAVVVGAIVGLAALGAFGDPIGAGIAAALAGAAAWLSDGWLQ